MKTASVVLACLITAASWAGPGHDFWECFNDSVSGGVACGIACNQCKSSTGSKVLCKRVCELNRPPVSAYRGSVRR